MNLLTSLAGGGCTKPNEHFNLGILAVFLFTYVFMITRFNTLEDYTFIKKKRFECACNAWIKFKSGHCPRRTPGSFFIDLVHGVKNLPVTDVHRRWVMF